MPQFELRDFQGYMHSLTSDDLETIGRWFAEMAPQMLSANSTMPDWRLRVWPTGYDDNPLAWKLKQDEFLIGKNHAGRVRFIGAMMEALNVSIDKNGELYAE